MAERYVGRHVRQTRQARHGAWVTKKRSRAKSGPQLLPTMAGLTVAGFLATGAAAGMHLSPAMASEDPSLAYDAADFPPPDPGARGQVYTSSSALGLRGAVLVESPGTDSSDVWLNTRLPVDSPSARSSVLPKGAQVLVTNPDTGRSVVVQVTAWGAESLELSRAAIEEIAPQGTKYIASVQYQVLPEGSYADAT